MTCPKCTYAQPDGATECPRCGVVFAKYEAMRNLAEASVVAPGPESSEDAPPSHGSGTPLKNLIFYAAPGTGMVRIVGRACLLLVISVWGLKFIFSSIQDNYAGNSFMHLVNLPFHEAGHILFSLFGRFMAVLGGSLTQCLVPLICMVAFLVRTRDPFAASVSLWWLGENLIDLAPYINDSRSLTLMLLGGVTGRDVDDYHDWEYILRTLGSLQYDHLLARVSHVTGALVIICACIWGAVVLMAQYKNRGSEGPR